MKKKEKTKKSSDQNPVVFGTSRSNERYSEEKQLKPRRKKMSYETEVTISRSNIVDQVAALLYATGKVPHDLAISNIQFSGLDKDLCTLKVFTREEVEVIRHK